MFDASKAKLRCLIAAIVVTKRIAKSLRTSDPTISSPRGRELLLDLMEQRIFSFRVTRRGTAFHRTIRINAIRENVLTLQDSLRKLWEMRSERRIEPFPVPQRQAEMWHDTIMAITQEMRTHRITWKNLNLPGFPKFVVEKPEPAS